MHIEDMEGTERNRKERNETRRNTTFNAHNYFAYITARVSVQRADLYGQELKRRRRKEEGKAERSLQLELVLVVCLALLWRTSCIDFFYIIKA